MNDETHPRRSNSSWLVRFIHALSPTPDTQEELISLLQKSHESQVIDSDALEIMEGALRVSEMHARDIMVARSQMEVVRVSDKPEDILAKLINSGHSRFPVIGDSFDDIRGILLAKDIIVFLQQGFDHFQIESLLRPANIIPESKRLTVLLREFREQRYHMAMVVDEYGSVAGLLTIEDILEEIVGDIEDETDESEPSSITKVGKDSWLIEAHTEIEDFNEYFRTGLNDDEYDTIGGLLNQSFGHLPKLGEVTIIEAMRFEIIEADSRRILKVKMTKIHPQDEE